MVWSNMTVVEPPLDLLCNVWAELSLNLLDFNQTVLVGHHICAQRGHQYAYNKLILMRSY